MMFNQSEEDEISRLCSRIDFLEKKIDVLCDILCRLSSGFKDLSDATYVKSYLDYTSSVKSCTLEQDELQAMQEQVSDNSDTAGQMYGTHAENVSAEENKETETIHREYVIRYLGAPSGNGFEVMNERTNIGVNTLYVLEIAREENYARFYPNVDNKVQLINERNYLFDPVCEAIGDLQYSSTLSVIEDNYGELELNGDYWILKKKCKVIIK